MFAEYERGVRADLEARSIRMAAREKQVADDEAEAHAQWAMAAANAAKQVWRLPKAWDVLAFVLLYVHCLSTGTVSLLWLI